MLYFFVRKTNLEQFSGHLVRIDHEEGGRQHTMKFKMILVDDETGQLAILSEIIQALAPDFDVVSFSSPKAVLTHLQQQQVHAVLCDIRMDEMDGLELCRQIRKLNSRIILGVISAYSDFHYAQTAIELGVKAYLTKPVSHEKLLELLNKIRTQIAETFGHPAPGAQSSPSWAEFCTGTETSYPFREGCSVDHPACMTMAAYLPGSLNEGKLKDAFPDSCLYLADLSKTLLLMVSFVQASHLPHLFEDFLKHLQWQSGPASPVPVRSASVLVSGMEKQQWKEAYEHLRRRMDAAFSAHPSPSASPVYPDSGARSVPVRIFASLEQDVLQALKRRDAQTLSHILQQFPLQVRKQNWRISESELKSNLRHLLLSAGRMTNHSFSTADMEILDQQIFLDTAVQQTLLVLNSMLNEHMTQMDSMGSALSQQLIDYVEAHYCEDISLESVANAFHLSASYVSSLFKQHANKGFRKYIIDRRIEQTQKLLLTTDMKVYEIADKVGYLDTTSFVKLFEREVGLSPSRYRRMGKKP